MTDKCYMEIADKYLLSDNAVVTNHKLFDFIELYETVMLKS